MNPASPQYSQQTLISLGQDSARVISQPLCLQPQAPPLWPHCCQCSPYKQIASCYHPLDSFNNHSVLSEKTSLAPTVGRRYTVPRDQRCILQTELAQGHCKRFPCAKMVKEGKGTLTQGWTTGYQDRGVPPRVSFGYLPHSEASPTRLPFQMVPVQ